MGDKYDEMDLNDMLALEGVTAHFDRVGHDEFRVDACWRGFRHVATGPTPEAALREALNELDGRQATKDLVSAHAAACGLLELLTDVPAPTDPKLALSRLSVGIGLPDLIRHLRAELGDDTPVETPEEFDPVTVGRQYLSVLFPLADNQAVVPEFDITETLANIRRLFGRAPT